MNDRATQPAAERKSALAETPTPARGRATLASLRAYNMVGLVVVVWIAFEYATGGIFLAPRNFSNLMRQMAVTGVLSVGMLMVIVAGQIDLSVGSLVGLTGMAAALSQTSAALGSALPFGVALLLGTLIGAAQGALVAYAGIPAFIVTLGGLLAWRGFTKGLSAGNTIPVTLDTFRFAGQEYLPPAVGVVIAILAIAGVAWSVVRSVRARRRYQAEASSNVAIVIRTIVLTAAVIALIAELNAYAGVPIPVLIFLAVAICGAFIMQNTVFGRYVYACGSNPEASRLSGINVRRQTLAVFCILGALAGVSGIIYTARVGSASPDAGLLLELDAIAACVIGGASLMGGRGTVFGACLGALFMASLDNGMSLKNVPDFIQDIVKGGILVAAVGLDVAGRRRR